MNAQVTEGAPRACGGGPLAMGVPLAQTRCSPRVRGWSPAPGGSFVAALVLPARAGVVPPPRSAPGAEWSAPRACGGGPQYSSRYSASAMCSPRVRGWSHTHNPPVDPVEVLPARAGMTPPSKHPT